MPSRKSSNPSPYMNRSGRFPMLRRSRVQAIALCACAAVVVIFILSHIFGGGDGIPSGTPPVVIVTVLNHEKYGKEYIENVKENRIQYAAKHGKIIRIRYREPRLITSRIHDILPNSPRL
jgi:mannan polymerase II complex MNN11 subunit